MKKPEHIPEWLELEQQKERKYSHFDTPLNLSKKIQSQDPQLFFQKFLSQENVGIRAFWPFIHFEKIERKFKKNEKNAKDRFSKKIRKIYYSSHLDSCIFSYYSFLI